MRIMTKRLAAVYMLIIILTVSGCQSSLTNVNPDDKNVLLRDNTITYTINTDIPKMSWDDPIAKEITKRTDVSLQYEIVVGGIEDKLANWLASGDYPDFISLHAQDLASYGKADAIYELTDLIKEHAPNIMRNFNNNVSLLKDPYGKIYGITVPPTIKNENPSTRGYFHIQYDVLREFGYPRITNLEQYYDLIKKYAERHKFINGNKILAFSTIGSGSSIFSSFSDIAMAYLGNARQGAFVIDPQGNVQFAQFQEDFLSLYKFLNRMNKDGLFDTESFLQNQEAFTQKCIQGNVIATIAPPAYLTACNAALIRNDMPERQFASFEIIKPGYESHVQDYPLTGGEQYLAISKNVKDPVRAITFIDHMFTLQNQILLGWGLEGQYYEIKEGKRVAKDHFLDQLHNEGLETMGLQHSLALLSPRNGNFLPDGQQGNILWTPENVVRNYDPATKGILSQYQANVWADLITRGKPVPNLLTRFPMDPQENKILSAIAAEHNRIVPNIIMEQDEAKIDGLWKVYLESAGSLGIHELENKMSQKWKNYVEAFHQ